MGMVNREETLMIQEKGKRCWSSVFTKGDAVA